MERILVGNARSHSASKLAQLQSQLDMETVRILVRISFKNFSGQVSSGLTNLAKNIYCTSNIDTL